MYKNPISVFSTSGSAEHVKVRTAHSVLAMFGLTLIVLSARQGRGGGPYSTACAGRIDASDFVNPDVCRHVFAACVVGSDVYAIGGLSMPTARFAHILEDTIVDLSSDKYAAGLADALLPCLIRCGFNDYAALLFGNVPQVDVFDTMVTRALH